MAMRFLLLSLSDFVSASNTVTSGAPSLASMSSSSYTYSPYHIFCVSFTGMGGEEGPIAMAFDDEGWEFCSTLLAY